MGWGGLRCVISCRKPLALAREKASWGVLKQDNMPRQEERPLNIAFGTGQLRILQQALVNLGNLENLENLGNLANLAKPGNPDFENLSFGTDPSPRTSLGEKKD